MQSIEQRIRDLLDDFFQKDEFQSVFLLDLKVNSGGMKIALFLDDDEGIDFETCREVSRYLEKHLEEENLVPERYKLEVSSPGVDRPLTVLRQYPKHIGRELEVKLVDSKKPLVGKLHRVEDSRIVLERKELPKKGVKAKDLKMEKVEIEFDSINQSKVLISFK